MQSVHGPWEAPGESVALFNDSNNEEHFISDTLRRTYAGMLRELDYTVENVTDALEAAGMWHGRSLLVLTSDKCVRPSAPRRSMRRADTGSALSTAEGLGRVERHQTTCLCEVGRQRCGECKTRWRLSTKPVLTDTGCPVPQGRAA